MKSHFIFLLSLSAAVAYADAPAVSNVSVTLKDEVPHLVTTTYELSAEAIVTASVFVNTNGVWEKLSGRPVETLGGDVFRKVAATAAGETRAIYWSPDESMEGACLTGDKVKVEVTAWPLETPPNYLVADLRVNNSIRYYPEAEDLPGGIGDKRYKSSYLVMRRIPAKNVTWLKGVSPKFQQDLLDRNPTAITTEKLHKVKLTHDYYFAVYPVTIDQWDMVMSCKIISDSRVPKQTVSYRDIRGQGANGTAWPAYDGDGNFDKDKSHAVDNDTFVKLLRTRTGLAYVDLPTEAQYEYAARAGHEGLLCSGEAWTSGNFQKYGHSYDNMNNPDCEGLNAGGRYATVGTYQPNAWGIYDVHGCGHQWCLDWYESFADYSQTEVYVDPVGPKTGTLRSTLGDRPEVWNVWRDCYIGRRLCFEPNNNVARTYYMTFRVAMTLY